MELTMETIELIADGCIALDRCDTINMAKQLLAEMDKTSVWTDAPEWATEASLHWRNNSGSLLTAKVYTRELPKSPEREIAEKYADKWDIHCDSIEQRRVADVIESAITEYKEWEANR